MKNLRQFSKTILRRNSLFSHSYLSQNVLPLTSKTSFSTSSNDDQYYALLYDYVENILEKRTPFRANHLSHATKYVESGMLRLGGAFADQNVDSALIVFKCDNIDKVKQFAENDPYVTNGLVTNWKVRPWTVVVGADYNKQLK